MSLDWEENRSNIIQGILGFLILNLLILSVRIDTTAWLTIGLGSTTVMLAEIFRAMRLFDVNDKINRILSYIKVIGCLLMIIGIFFGTFFSGVSFVQTSTYHFIVALLIGINFIMVINEIRETKNEEH